MMVGGWTWIKRQFEVHVFNIRYFPHWCISCLYLLSQSVSLNKQIVPPVFTCVMCYKYKVIPAFFLFFSPHCILISVNPVCSRKPICEQSIPCSRWHVMESMKGQKTLPEGFLALSQSRGQQVQPPPQGWIVVVFLQISLFPFRLITQHYSNSPLIPRRTDDSKLNLYMALKS